MGVSTWGETVGFVGVEVEPASFYRAVRRCEIEGLPGQPLSLLNICARTVALEAERDCCALDLTRLPPDLKEVVQHRIYRFAHYPTPPPPTKEELLALREELLEDEEYYGFLGVAAAEGALSDPEDDRPVHGICCSWNDTCWGKECGCLDSQTARCRAAVNAVNEALHLPLATASDNDEQCYTGRARRRPRLSLFNYEIFSNYQSHPPRLFLCAFHNHFRFVEVDFRKFKSGQSCAVVCPPSARERLLIVDAVRLLRLKPLGQQPEFLAVRTANCG